jgi:DNA polymerase III epsilon subunit-like protein
LNNGSFVEEKRVNILINPKIPIPYGSSQVHHIYDIDIKNAPYIDDVIDEIM